MLKNLKKVLAVYCNSWLSCCSVNWMQCWISEIRRLLAGKSIVEPPVVYGLKAGGGLFAQTVASDDKYAMGAVATAEVNPNPPWRNGACKVSTKLRKFGGRLRSSVLVSSNTLTAAAIMDSSNCWSSRLRFAVGVVRIK